MGKSYWILSSIVILVQFCSCNSEEHLSNSYTISSIAYPSTRLGAYEWRYIRVDLPPHFSSMSLALESDVDLDLNKFERMPVGSLAIICFREGSLPLPDILTTSKMGLVMDHISNDSFVGNQSLHNIEKCYPMQRNISLRVTNEQISAGTWYFGLFNGIGPLRTQSKMINRGRIYSFSANISVEGCSIPMVLGTFCNQTVDRLSCNRNYNITRIEGKNEAYNSAREKNIIACGNANGIVCHENDGPEVYSLDVEGIVEELLISAVNVTFNQAQNSNVTGIRSLTCYVRYKGIPLNKVYDFSGDISKGPLVIQSPRAGRWYISILPIHSPSISNGLLNHSLKACYLLEWQVLQCPAGKAGLNCTSDRYALQAVIKKESSIPFQSSYLPITEKAYSSDSASFHLEPLLTNFSHGDSLNGGWTFFALDIPSGSAMVNIHVHLASDIMQNYEIYARYGGLPSLTSWDYFYANMTNSSSNTSMFFKIYELTEETLSFYMLYAKIGTWYFGMRQLNPSDPRSHTDVSLSIDNCPNKCSSHGVCQSSVDASGLILYSYCHCDLDHGGFDCSIELVSQNRHIIHSILLIASNAAALLPAYWSLRSKAFAEWVLFTCSGMSSAVYHACDSGVGCLLGFHVLQFFDFWLSFLAVINTFIHLTTIKEASKRTIHIIVSLLTALLAQTDPTRSKNISIVMGLGALGLLIGWLLEFWTHKQSISIPRDYRLDLRQRWYIIRGWVRNIFKTILRQYHWGFIGAGIFTLALAAVAWTMENSKTYWIWHSLWHIFIYTCSFFFLCSKPSVLSLENQEAPDPIYELTRQTSFTGNEEPVHF